VGAEMSAVELAAEIRHLSPAEARKERPVSLRAVVTYVNIQSGELFVQDRSAGIFVFVRHSSSNLPLRSGQLVDISGVTAPGDFSSSVTKAQIKVIGHAQMPKPVHLPFEQILTGEEDSQWGYLSGVVRSGREENGVLYLNTVTSGGLFLAILKEYPANWATTLVDSRISLYGVLAALFNDHRQVTGVRIFVPSTNFIHVDERAPASPFDLPESPIPSVGVFRTKQDWSKRIRVRASILAVASQNLIYVSDGQSSIPVELRAPCPAKPGLLADVVGFPANVEGRPGLKNAVCRIGGGGILLPAIELSAYEIVPSLAVEDGSGLAIAKGTRNDLRLVTVKGSVIQIVKGTNSRTLALMSADQTFSVTIPDSVQLPEDLTEPGSELEVTGLCLITFDEYHRAQSFRLLARGLSDVRIVSRATWLTVRRALWIIFPLLAIVFGAFVWILVLRRHVASRTNELRVANSRLKRLAVEDWLTGAANRRCFDETIRNETARLRDTDMQLSLLLIDLDHFKQVNDLYGHQRGDQNLIQVVGALRAALTHTPNSLLARYGGEEFAVLLPETNQGAAVVMAEQLRISVEQMAIPHERSSFDQRQTVSVGVGTLTPGTVEPSTDTLVDMTDRALYRAKHSGRNRVVAFGSGALPERTNAGGVLDDLFRAAVPLVGQPPKAV
jgi:diguanylate cyclase (GGDEF)-like protein